MNNLFEGWTGAAGNKKIKCGAGTGVRNVCSAGAAPGVKKRPGFAGTGVPGRAILSIVVE